MPPLEYFSPESPESCSAIAVVLAGAFPKEPPACVNSSPVPGMGAAAKVSAGELSLFSSCVDKNGAEVSL